MNILQITKQVLEGAGATFFIFFTTIILSLPLGMIVAVVKCNTKNIVLKSIIDALISILRGTPLMLQLIVWFYFPYFVMGIKLTYAWRLMAIVLGFSINYAAYFAEIFRAGIENVPIGQTEAAKVLGYSKAQTFFKIILPQAIKRVIPPVTNEVITLVKDTSLSFAISYAEVFTLAKQISAAKTTILPLFIAGAFYYIFNNVVSFAMKKIENSFNYFE